MGSRSNWGTGFLTFSFAIYWLHGFRHTCNFPLTPFQHLQDRKYNSNFSHFQNTTMGSESPRGIQYLKYPRKP